MESTVRKAKKISCAPGTLSMSRKEPPLLAWHHVKVTAPAGSVDPGVGLMTCATGSGQIVCAWAATTARAKIAAKHSLRIIPFIVALLHIEFPVDSFISFAYFWPLNSSLRH